MRMCWLLSVGVANHDKYGRIREGPKACRGQVRFFVHAAVYAAVMVLLVLINLLTLPGTIWFIWPLIGWGFAVALHGVGVYLLADKTVVLDALTERELRHGAAHKTD